MHFELDDDEGVIGTSFVFKILSLGFLLKWFLPLIIKGRTITNMRNENYYFITTLSDKS